MSKIPTKKHVFEVLEAVSAAKTKEDKIKVLQSNTSVELKTLLRGAFDSSLVWLVPEGRPPFEPLDEHGYPIHLSKQMNKFQYFIKGGPGEKMIPARVERMFIEILGTSHVKEADLLCKVKDKKLGRTYKGLTKPLILDAFPGLLRG